MATFNKFNCFVEDLAEKAHDLGSDTITVALTNSAPVATNTVIGDITQISYTGLSTRNFTRTSSSQTSGTYKLILQDLTLTASGSIPSFRYAVIYNSTNDKLIGWVDYGSSINMANTDQFIIDVDQVNGILSLT